LFNKLEAIAKCAALPDERFDLDRAVGQRKFQLNDLVKWDFHFEDGSNARFADVDGAPGEWAAGVGLDSDFDIELETRARPQFDKAAKLAGSKLIRLHFSSSRVPEKGLSAKVSDYSPH
jgi:hypothetical protein